MALKGNPKIIAFSLLLIILSTGLLLRLDNLMVAGYSPDEAFSIHHASLTFKEIIGNSGNEPHPPLYYILLHFWMGIFGISEIATRSLSAIFGVVSVFITYQLGRLLFNRETGMIASLIVTVSTFHITYSQESRMYSLMAMLTLVSMFFFIKMMREKSIKFTVYYQLSSILLMYSHIYGFFIILAQNLYLMATSLKSKKQKQYISLKKWITIQMILAAAFIPWIWVLIHQIIGIENGSFVNINWLPFPHLSDLFNTFSLYTYYDPITLVLFSLLSLCALIPRAVDGGKMPGALIFLLIWLFVPILVPFAISKLAFPIYYPKYTIAASFSFYMLVARGISKINNKYIKGLLLAAVIYFSLTSIIYNW